MAGEASISVSLRILKGNLDYTTPRTTQVGNVEGMNGPTPGAVNITTGGTDVDLSQLVTPGYCHLKNLDSTNYVEYGIWEPATSTFYPFGELRAGESYVIRFSRNLLEEYSGVGTATTGPTNTFRMKANYAACKVVIEAFEA